MPKSKQKPKFYLHLITEVDIQLGLKSETQERAEKVMQAILKGGIEKLDHKIILKKVDPQAIKRAYVERIQ